MGILRKMRLFMTLEFKTIRLFSEAFIYLGWARILVAIPFSKVAPSLGKEMQETSHAENPGDKSELRNVRQAIHLMGRYTPWQSQCLVRAIAGMKMLEKRKIESTLYLGTAKDKDGAMIAHAWLRSGPFYITGEETMRRFKVAGKFASQTRTAHRRLSQ